MKREFLCVCFLLSLTACSSWTGPTTPTTQPEATKTHPTVITIADPTPTPAVPVAPVVPVPAPRSVSVYSEATKATTQVLVMTSAEPPTCAWRNDVVKVHIDLGGSKNDIVTLANLHKVYIVDTGAAPGYRLTDYPSDWCTGPK